MGWSSKWSWGPGLPFWCNTRNGSNDARALLQGRWSASIEISLRHLGGFDCWWQIVARIFSEWTWRIGPQDVGGYVVFITMARKFPKDRVIPLPNGLDGLYIEVTNYLLTGMILQEPPPPKKTHGIWGIDVPNLKYEIRGLLYSPKRTLRKGSEKWICWKTFYLIFLLFFFCWQFRPIFRGLFAVRFLWAGCLASDFGFWRKSWGCSKRENDFPALKSGKSNLNQTNLHMTLGFKSCSNLPGVFSHTSKLNFSGIIFWTEFFFSIVGFRSLNFLESKMDPYDFLAATTCVSWLFGIEAILNSHKQKTALIILCQLRKNSIWPWFWSFFWPRERPVWPGFIKLWLVNQPPPNVPPPEIRPYWGLPMINKPSIRPY